ncbi:Nif3-like dinuclear metal center hexameric protein [Clostridium gasigenes]|uniref:GTP cyclohydrolase 1 type 2 homolog n=1 Tax=Clostridium gasigenes TaxID=94869 RepID=A0A1H0TXF6_9CLOT|nr:Nif3-like dinuclear metal center hexameric protein [Clostridium gasigenes]MBB6624316.1 Nif3-like dinuclear metal center hexameric protein [Clostridium gasigenes]MBU3089229.1 Nif3-like dinuclear metal center hexameric protein [Clostridium gasigenes]MBU3105224.1 Nif3-like dinuclear metal center hexameric protein [Clostridium gasigenes]MBU3109357.1 Nif3-like dinuclear metal center hexameric protein [Clostridium gasigenes]NKF07029.1 Nif3-like dinuclear metal center hexameric protein [Clostridiu
MIKVEQIIKAMEKIAPVYLKEDFDNVGLMVGDKAEKVKRVLFALDCTLEVIEEAKDLKVDLIISHHPLIFNKPKSITTDTLQGKKIIKLIRSNINLYSSHTNLDSAENGLNQTIVEMLGFKSNEILEKSKITSHKNAGLGRMIRLDKEIDLTELISTVKSKLNINTLRVVDGNRKIKNIAIINGSGQSFFSQAVKMGADCIITGDTTYHFALDYKEMGVTIIDTGHFSSEWLVFLKAMEKIKEEFKEIEFITSTKVEDPYKFI